MAQPWEFTYPRRKIPYIWSNLLKPQERFLSSDDNGEAMVWLGGSTLEGISNREHRRIVREDLRDLDWPSEYWEGKTELDD